MKSFKKIGLLCMCSVFLASCNGYKETNLSGIIDFINEKYFDAGKTRKTVKNVNYSCKATDMPDENSQKRAKAELGKIATGIGVNYDSNTFEISNQKIDLSKADSQKIQGEGEYIIDEALIVKYEQRIQDKTTDYIKYFTKGNEMMINYRHVYNTGHDDDAHNIDNKVNDYYNNNGQMDHYHTVQILTYRDNNTFTITTDVTYEFND